jgi:L-fucose isomerase-like protein
MNHVHRSRPAARAIDMWCFLSGAAPTQEHIKANDVAPTSNLQANIMAFNTHKYQICELTHTHNKQCLRKLRRTARRCSDITRRRL